MTSFENKKYLRVECTLSTGKFGSVAKDTIVLDGYSVRADIRRSVGFIMGSLSAKIYGLSASDLNSLTVTQWTEGYINRNKIKIIAIDGKMESIVFYGDIINAWANYSSMPDVYLEVEAQNHYTKKTDVIPKPSTKECVKKLGNIGPTDVISIKDNVPIDKVFQIIADSLCLQYENRSGIDMELSNVYLKGSPLDQLSTMHDFFDIDFYIDETVLAIVPKGTPRVLTNQNSSTESGGRIPIISPKTGLIGYPTFNGFMAFINVLYNPEIVFGGKIIVETSVPQANGEWFVMSINHKLDSETPDGVWYSELMATRTQNAITK